MAKIVDYGTYIIDLADAMIDHQQGLSNQHLSRLSVIRDRSVRFVTSCIQHENSDLETLYSFLDGDGLKSVMFVISYSEYLLMDDSLHTAYTDAIGRIRDCGFAIRDELNQMKEDLVGFMGKIGLSVPQPESSSNKRIKRLQPVSALQVDYLDNEPEPLPVQAGMPIRRLQARNTTNQQSEQKPVRRIQHVQAAARPKIRRLQPQH